MFNKTRSPPINTKRIDLLEKSIWRRLIAGELTARDDWEKVPELVLENNTARAAARPGTQLYKRILSRYVEEKFALVGCPGNLDDWFNAYLDHRQHWEHQGGGTSDGLRWSVWAHINFCHTGLLYVRDEATTESVVCVTSVL